MPQSAFRHPGRSRHLALRTGITLIEMLVAIAVSLIVMYAVIKVFDQLNDGMNRSKAIIEQAGELRNVSHRLRQDLDGVTASTLPWTPVGAGDGYLEIVEGPQSDADRDSDGVPDLADLNGDGNNELSMWGDLDDVLIFTARSKGRPFIGRFNNTLIESELAEIIYWTANLGDLNGNSTVDPGEMALMRRVLLIRPDLSPTGGNVAAFFQSNDVSVRLESGMLVANSLADLTLRQNRTFHAAGFPHAMNVAALTPIDMANAAWGTDVVLTNVVAFDVRVYDPLAPVRQGTGSALTPGDPRWAAATTTIGRGAYVDLNYAGNPAISLYSGPPNARSQLTAPTWSTWPFFYEQDGIDQDDATDGTAGIDQGTNGFNNPIDRFNNTTLAPGADGADDNPLADDPGEYETEPPYPHTIPGEKMLGLRGIEVRIRIVEPDTRSVRQASVVSSFVPD